MDLFLNAWFKEKNECKLLVQTNKQIYSVVFFLGVWGCQREQWLFIFIKGLFRLLIIFVFLFWTPSKSAQSTTQMNIKAFVCLAFYITVQSSFSLGDGHGAVYWIYSYLAFDFFSYTLWTFYIFINWYRSSFIKFICWNPTILTCPAGCGQGIST